MRKALYIFLVACSALGVYGMDPDATAASPLVFETRQVSDIPVINPDSRTIEGEYEIRGGLPGFFSKVKRGEPVTVAFLGGSITQADYCYRLQLCSYLESKYLGVKFTFVNAGVAGTGADLGASRLQEHVLNQNPDLVMIEFSVNGAYTPAMEGIIRKIKKHDPDTDVCLLYSVTEPQMRLYQQGKLPESVVEEERLAVHYGIPSVHMGKSVAMLEADGQVMWQGMPGEDEGMILFSRDGLHPVATGGSLYAEAVARMLAACGKADGKKAVLPEPLYGEEWEQATMYVPAGICKTHGLWKQIKASDGAPAKQFENWFDTVMTSDHPKSTISFAFEGDMFGLFDIGGPEMGQLEVYVDGQMVRLRNVKDKGFEYFEATDLVGSHWLNRFNRWCDNRYRGQHVWVKVAPGLHQVTLKLSEDACDKRKILGEGHLADITANPARYAEKYLRLGRILVRGNVAECKPVKGLPPMKQQLKWEKKINDYMERDAEQAELKDATLVVGSSSIDMWKSLETDFPGKNVIRRGISGTKAIDLYNYRHLLIEPFNPKRIIIYEGDNEIGFKWEVDEMMESMERLFHEVRAMKPDAEIYLVSVKPSPVRENVLGKIQEFNRRLKAFAESQERTGFIDIHTPMLTSDGKVRPELFLSDRLHPAQAGYDIWREQFGKVINKK